MSRLQRLREEPHNLAVPRSSNSSRPRVSPRRCAIRRPTTNSLAASSVAGSDYSVLVQRLATPVTYDGHKLATVEIAGAIPTNTVGLAGPSGSPITAKYRALREMILSPDVLQSDPTPCAGPG